MKPLLPNSSYNPTLGELTTCLQMDYAKLVDSFFDKKVLLIGGSKSADSLDYGEFSPYEYKVIQVNDHILRRPTHRCDWLVMRSGCGMTAEIVAALPQFRNIQTVSTACNKRLFADLFHSLPACVVPFFDGRYAKVNPFHPALEWCNQLWHEINSTPLTGLIALKMAQLLPVSEIRMVGFDFWYDKKKGFQNMRDACHYMPNQIAWFKHQYHTDFRIEIEDSLKEQLKIGGRGVFHTVKADTEWSHLPSSLSNAITPG